MKNLFYSIISLVNSAYLQLKKESDDFYSGNFFLTRIIKDKKNKIKLTNTKTSKTSIQINGFNNQLICNDSLIEKSSIVIQGRNNQLVISEKVKLRKANIVIRGDNCKIEIGTETTFGGIRMINVGKGNEITIGSNCLFSDQIELWASDTHSIFDEKGVLVNRERPIKIGDYVWVGSRVTILKGVSVSSGSVIGMGTIVTKDIPVNSISVGSPNKIIKTNISWSLDY